MRVWVTGASSLLAKSLLPALAAQDIAHAGSTREQADLADFSSLERFYRHAGPFTHIVNCAAYTRVDTAESCPEEAWQINAEGPALLGKLAKRHALRIVHLSTDYVFGGEGNRPYAEDDPAFPQTVYGATKRAGELRLLDILPEACVIRTSWLFGPGGKNFVSRMLELMQKEPVLRVVADQRGRPTYAPHLAAAILEALNGFKGLYHYASLGDTTWHALAEHILQEIEPRVLCREILPLTTLAYNAPAKRPLYSVLDTKKWKTVCSQPLRPWQEGVSELCAPFNASS